MARACTRISATLADTLRAVVSTRRIRPLNGIRESGEWQWTLIPLAEQRALVTQPDEDSKAVRFRRHTICKEYQNGTRFVQHTSRHSSDCLPDEARERRRALERNRMSLPYARYVFHRFIEHNGTGDET